MDIKDFVSSTISQIMQGVAESQSVAREVDGYVNPALYSVNNGNAHLGFTSSGHAIYPIEFDIAVSVVTESGMEGGGKLQVASIVGLGGQARTGEKQETISRVKFAVPLTLPVDPDSEAARDERNKQVREANQRRKEQRLAAINRSMGGRDW